MEVLVWIGFSQSLFAGILLLFAKKERTTADKLLIAWLFILAFDFLMLGIDLNRGFIHLTNAFFIFNPLLYFYTRSLINPSVRLKPIDLVHVLPYLILKLGAYVFHVELSINELSDPANLSAFKLIYIAASILSFFGYSIPSLINIHRYRINLKNEFSTIDSRITLGWLLFVIIYYMIFIILAYLLGIVQLFTHINTYSLDFTYGFLLSLIYIFSFYGLLQNRIYPQSVSENAGNGYKNPRLDSLQKEKIKKRLIEYFEKEKPWLQSDLNIGMVSKKLGVSRHALTEVLNTLIGKNFYGFVNGYRVNEVKRIIKNPEYAKYSIDAIGYECGFNSKSTFYTVFKNETGMTPLRYKTMTSAKDMR